MNVVNPNDLSPEALCSEVAMTAFVSDRPVYSATGVFHHVSPTGESSTPFRPTKQIACLQFLLDAAAGQRDISAVSQKAVDLFIDQLSSAKEGRDD